MASDSTPNEVKYPDFIVCSRVLYITRLTNQLMNVRYYLLIAQQNNQRKVLPALETALL